MASKSGSTHTNARPEDEAQWLWQPATEDIELVKVLQALADPVRLHLFALYAAGGEYDCTRDTLGLERLHKSTVTHHLRTLRMAGLTSTQVVGRNRYVHLRRDDLESRFPGLIDALLAGAS